MAKIRFLAVAACCVVVATACSSSSSSNSNSSGNAGGQTTSITVGTAPALSNLGLYLAASPAGGQFAKNHLKMTPKVIQSGAQAIPLLLNGQLQFTAGDTVGAMVAIANHIPLVIVASGNVAGQDATHDNTGLIVKANSGINTASDLSGKTVAVNALNGTAEIAAKSAIDKSGGDSSKIKFVELAIPDMQAAVQNGTVDAAVTAEPFLTSALGAGLKLLLPGMSVAMRGVPQSVYLTSKSYAAAHPEVVKAFKQSITAANQQLTSDPSLIQTVAAKSTTLTPTVLSKIVLPVFNPPMVAVSTLESLQNLMVKYGALKATYDLAPFVFAG
jgi:NitT/TauT family transport system substrate-binding protein